MSRSLETRLAQLEHQARARDGATWAEVHAAAERLRGHAVATLAAVLHGQDPPAYEETTRGDDWTLVDQWCRAHGTSVDREGARARLVARLTTLAARHAADVPV